jgi:hypothetical protein
MIPSIRLPLTVAFLAFVALPITHAQEALEIRGDQDAPSTSPTPGHRAAEPDAPAESDTTATPGPEGEAPTPKKKKAPVDNVQEMSPDEFKKAGLDKLSPDELRTLNQWLKGYRHQAEAKAAEEATEQTRESARDEATAEAKKKFNGNWMSTDRIFSRIDGEFHGLRRDGKKMIIRLEDGTVWKQANETDRVYEAKLTDHPPVMVTHSVVGYKMHVIGAGEFYVNPVRPH